MLIRFECQSCHARLKVPDHLEGKKIRCPKCSQVIVAHSEEDVVTLAEPLPVPPPVPAPPRPTRRSENKEAFTSRPSAAPSSRRRNHDDEEDEVPRPRSRRNDDSEDEPKRSKLTFRPNLLIWAGGGAAGLLLLVVVIIVLFKPHSSPPQNAAAALDQRPKAIQQGQQPVDEQPLQPQAQALPKRLELPAGVGPAQIAPDNVKMVKRATAYLKVKLADGTEAQGSGFFALEKGLVFTNAHVLGMLSASSGAPKSVEIVVNSGEASQFKRNGRVLGVDRENDLGVLRVEGDIASLPEPLAVDTSRSLAELVPVYIFGFPFGKSLGENITITESKVSSLRKSADGVVYQVQVNGGMHPGNSGGPVVDTRGVVVGVSVAIIVGTTINFAVPGEKVLDIAGGRVQETRLGFPFRDQGQIKLPVKIACLDPLQRIHNLQVEVWTGPEATTRPASRDAPAVLPGDSPRQVASVNYQAGTASQNVVLPSLSVPPGHAVWLQPVFVNQANVKQWGPASRYRPADGPALDRVPASLVAKLTTGERSLKLASKMTVQVNQGRNEKIIEGDSMDVDLLEALETSPKGASIRLLWGKSQFSTDINGKKALRRANSTPVVKNYVHNFECDPKAGLFTFGFVKFNMADPVLNEEANDMASLFLTSYQFVSLPLPNRETQPLETWEAKMRLMLGREKKKDVMDIVMTCTYEGSRKENNKTEALISLLGEIRVIKSDRPMLRKPTDRVTGYALFDPDVGHISKMHITLNDETDISGITLTRNFVADLTRVVGNTLAITMPPPKAKSLAAAQPNSDVRGSNAGSIAKVIPGDLFPFLKKAVEENRTADVDVRGFTATQDTYRHVYAEGGLLTGFQVSFKDSFGKPTIDGLRPIYNTASGEKLGVWFGRIPPKPFFVKAKPGYVVAAINIRTSLGIDGFSVRYTKFGKDRLIEEDSYETPWIGSTGGAPPKLAAWASSRWELAAISIRKGHPVHSVSSQS